MPRLLSRQKNALLASSVAMRGSGLRLHVLSQLQGLFELAVKLVTTKENKTVYGDIEILYGLSYGIHFLG